MSKKQLQDLQKENANLKIQVQSFQSQIADLNENTVISSMNEMKERYDTMIENTVCKHKFFDLKSYYTRYFNLAKTIDNVNDVIREDINRLIHFVNFYNPDYTNFSEDTRNKRVNSDLADVSNRLLMVSQLINRQVEDEWSDGEYSD